MFRKCKPNHAQTLWNQRNHVMKKNYCTLPMTVSPSSREPRRAVSPSNGNLFENPPPGRFAGHNPGKNIDNQQYSEIIFFLVCWCILILPNSFINLSTYQLFNLSTYQPINLSSPRIPNSLTYFQINTLFLQIFVKTYEHIKGSKDRVPG